jgi:two-component system nitrogen regulation response regulator GlnG
MADDQTTLQPGAHAARSEPGWRLVLTILAHPDPRRVGARSVLPRAGVTELSRRSPVFDEAPLDDPYLSRKPSRLAVERGALRVEPNLAGAELRADGAPVTATRSFGPDELEVGVILEVGGRVALLAQRVAEVPREADACGLVGLSDGIEEVRRQIRLVSDLDVSVLIRGESGVGKELVASAIHRGSARRRGPFLAVNMAALTPTTAASALFGHRRGAFTGADRPRSGLFREADGGTLFLDEIGEAPAELQAMLLRALETGQV